MSKIVLVGQAPGPRSDPKAPLSGAAGRRLAALAGLDHAEFLRRFERVNLVDEFPGKAGKGDAFDVRAARDRADQLREGWTGRKAVLLGRGVAAAFRLVPDDYAWFQPLELPPGLEVAVMPHPSGISHWWNDPTNVEGARDYMLRLAVGWGDPVKAAVAAAGGDFARAAQVLSEETGRRVDARELLASWSGSHTYLEDGSRMIDVMTGGVL